MFCLLTLENSNTLLTLENSNVCLFVELLRRQVAGDSVLTFHTVSVLKNIKFPLVSSSNCSFFSFSLALFVSIYHLSCWVLNSFIFLYQLPEEKKIAGSLLYTKKIKSSELLSISLLREYLFSWEIIESKREIVNSSHYLETQKVRTFCRLYFALQYQLNSTDEKMFYAFIATVRPLAGTMRIYQQE